MIQQIELCMEKVTFFPHADANGNITEYGGKNRATAVPG